MNLRKICHKKRKQNPLPVTPSSQYSANKDDQESCVGDPHDEGHGIDTKDCPGRGNRGRHRFGATGI